MSSQKNQVYLFHVQMGSTNSNDVAKNFLDVSKCLPNISDKVFEVVLTFPPWLIILEIRVEQGFMELVLVLVIPIILEISAPHAP